MNHNQIYKLSRNVAVFLANDEAEFEKIYKEVKGYYDLRSTFLHTGQTKLKHNKIDMETLVSARDVLRKCLIMVR